MAARALRALTIKAMSSVLRDIREGFTEPIVQLGAGAVKEMQA
jgi:hypothetical protein